MRLVTGLFISLLLATLTPSAAAQGKGNGKHTNYDNERKTAVSVSVSIGSNDQRIIREWFLQSASMRGLPPGLAKKEQLPPGLQKHLVRFDQLPPGLQKKIQPLPQALEARLTRLPEGRRRIILNGSVILLDQRKNLILDIMAVF